MNQSALSYSNKVKNFSLHFVNMYTFTSPQDGGGEESKQPHLGQLEDKGRIAQIMKSAN